MPKLVNCQYLVGAITACTCSYGHNKPDVIRHPNGSILNYYKTERGNGEIEHVAPLALGVGYTGITFRTTSSRASYLIIWDMGRFFNLINATMKAHTGLWQEVIW